MNAENMSGRCVTASDAGQMQSENWGTIFSHVFMKKSNFF
jgi:hypothetical protein